MNPIGEGRDLPKVTQMVKLRAVIPAHLLHYTAQLFSRCQLPMMRTWFRLCIKTKGALKDKCIRRQREHSFSKNRFEIFCCVHNNFLPHLGRLALILCPLTRVSPCHGSSGSPKDTPTPPVLWGGLCLPPYSRSTRENLMKWGDGLSILPFPKCFLIWLRHRLTSSKISATGIA